MSLVTSLHAAQLLHAPFSLGAEVNIAHLPVRLASDIGGTGAVHRLMSDGIGGTGLFDEPKWGGIGGTGSAYRPLDISHLPSGSWVSAPQDVTHVQPSYISKVRPLSDAWAGLGATQPDQRLTDLLALQQTGNAMDGLFKWGRNLSLG